MTPIDEYEQLRKTAGFADFGKGFSDAFGGKTLGNVAAIGAGTAAIAGAGTVLNKMRMALTKKRDFDAMMHHNPDLEQARAGNPELFAQQYTSLRNVSPQFGRDPLIAGTFMRSMSEYPGAAGSHLLAAAKADSPQQPAWMQASIGRFGRGPAQERSPEEMAMAKNKLEEYEQMAPVRALKREKAVTDLQAHAQQNP